MKADITLVQEAQQLATGSDVHDVEKGVIWYLRCADNCKDNPYIGRHRDKIFIIWDKWLREFVVEKKLSRLRR